ncbi:serine/threonine protein phosphatase [Frankia torreyi]|uniref:Serine/threonine protein phosphatase n=1 Tax=Frankia torreyi TaxID=1856 RepID=A0A0D8B761_9ACTN|nr:MULTISPECIES: protein phosphatase 2C domain-containing protein [Frankia]KJE20133.1 serine/threonine protein phosphatase [Frankia torreyi]
MLRGPRLPDGPVDLTLLRPGRRLRTASRPRAALPTAYRPAPRTDTATDGDADGHDADGHDADGSAADPANPLPGGRSLATADLGAAPSLPPPPFTSRVPRVPRAPAVSPAVTKPLAVAVAESAGRPTPAPSAPGAVVAGAATRAGGRTNEDFHLVGDNFAGVADGVGGEAAGEIASALALTTIAALRPARQVDLATALEQAVRAANTAVRARARADARLDGMATTVDVLVVRPSGRQRTAVVAHVGDGTIWHRGPDTPCAVITRPHAIDGGPLLRAVGQTDALTVETITVSLGAHDRFVLATDGLTEMLTPEGVAARIDGMGALPPAQAAAALLALAEAAGTRDDTTVVVVDVG